MTFESTHWTWMNGRFVSWEESKVPLATHALHYATGVFEGIRSYVVNGAPAIFRLDEHLDRFFQSAAVYDLKIPYTKAQLTDAICGVIQRNGFGESYIRPLAYMGAETLGLRGQCSTETAILAWPNIAHVSAESQRAGARLTVSPYRKFDKRMMPTTAKACGQYLNSRLATMEALKRGYDEALLLDINDNVAEAAVANVFVVRDRVLITNEAKISSILMGITRDAVLQIAAALGYATRITTLRVEDIEKADEVFLTGTACEIVPIAELDGKPIGLGRPGTMTVEIRAIFDRAKTGQAKEWEHWLHRVPSLEAPGKAAVAR